MIVGLVLSLAIALSGPVHRWSSSVPIQGEEVTYTDQGVSVRPQGEIIPILIPWFDVRSIPNGWVGDAAKYKEVAEMAHKARDRRMRGDPVAAGKLYRELDAQLHSAQGEQSLDITIGLMESGLASGRMHDAFVSWLRALRSGGKSEELSAAGVDLQTGLHPAILPVFQAGVEDFESLLPKEIDERGEILFRYFQLVMDPPGDEQADQTLGELLKQVRKRGGRDEGLVFVHDLVKCQVSADPVARKAARESLARRLRSGVPGWMESWARLASGVSLIGESDTELREKGLLECLEVVVSSRGTPVSVVYLAANIAAEYLRSTGREQYADTVLMTAFFDNESTTDSRP